MSRDNGKRASIGRQRGRFSLRATCEPSETGISARSSKWLNESKAYLPAFWGSRRFSLAERSRLLESAQCRNGAPVMFLRVPRGSVLLQKVEHLLKDLHKESELCLENIRFFALPSTQFIKFGHGAIAST